MDGKATVRAMLSAVVGAGLGAVSAYWYVGRYKSQDTELQQALDSHPALRYGLPQDSVVRVFRDYVAVFDQRSRCPKWVLEHISREKGNGKANRKGSDFFEDMSIEPRFRSRQQQYRGSGYDRGHMAPAGNYKYDQRSMDETFSLVNMSPQVGKGFNRDYWARFEKFVKDVTRRADDVLVITGPLYLPSAAPGGGYQVTYPVIGTPPEFVSVPTHFFKVVLAESSGTGGGGHSAVGAFVMPNAEIHPNVPLTAFSVPLTTLESVAGTRFFPKYLDDTRRAALDDAALAFHAAGRQQMQRAGAVPGTASGSAAQQQRQHQLLLPAPPAVPRIAAPPPPSSSSSSVGGGVSPHQQQQVSGGGAGRGIASSDGRSAPKQLSLPEGQAAPASVGGVGPHAPGPAAPLSPATGGAVMHLCEAVACRLPAEEFWKRSDSFKSSSGPGRAESGG